MTARGEVRSGAGIGNTRFGLLATLKGFVFSATDGVAFFVFIDATFVSSLLYQHLLEMRNLEISREIARQSAHAIQQVLQRGGARRPVDAVITGSKAAVPPDRKTILPCFQTIFSTATGTPEMHELLMRIQLGDQVIAANAFIEAVENMGIAHKNYRRWFAQDFD